MKNLILFTALILTLQTLFGQQVERQLVGSTGKYFSNSKGSMSWSVGELMTATFSTANNAFTQGFQQPDAVCQFSDTEPPLLSDCPGDITSCSPVTAFFPPFVSDNCSLVDVQRTVTTTTTFTSVSYTHLTLPTMRTV